MLDYILKLIICFLLSLFIGVERQYHKRNIGLRTIILVSIGSFLFVSFSIRNDGNFDVTRIAAQVVAGIGFLGAGVIIKDGDRIKGLTTAATLWCSAAIGVLTAGGLILEAALGAFLILFTNMGLRKVNSLINNYPIIDDETGYTLSVICPEKNETNISKKIETTLKNNNNKIISQLREDTKEGLVKINIFFKNENRLFDLNHLMNIFKEDSNIKSINITKNMNLTDNDI